MERKKRKTDSVDGMLMQSKRAKLECITIIDDAAVVKQSKIESKTAAEEFILLSDDEDNEILSSICVDDAAVVMQSKRESQTAEECILLSDDEDNEILSSICVVEPLAKKSVQCDLPVATSASANTAPKSLFKFKTPFFSRFQSCNQSAAVNVTPIGSAAASTSTSPSPVNESLFTFSSNRVAAITDCSTIPTASATSASANTAPKSLFKFKTPFFSRFPASSFSRFQASNEVAIGSAQPALKTLAPVTGVWDDDGLNDIFRNMDMSTTTEAGHKQQVSSGNIPTETQQQSLLRVLKEKFNLNSFRHLQSEIINSTLTGNDCLVVLPTGGGKSLCFQLPAVMHKGVTIVVCPLKSLMLDQVNKLNGLGICAASMSEKGANIAIYKDLSSARPTIKLLYTTPEMLTINATFRKLLEGLHKKGLLARFVFDEAHCVTEGCWEFRPQYKKLCFLSTTFKSVPFMALTASATPRVLEIIVKCLGLRNCITYMASIDRPNLKYIVNVKRNSSLVDCIDLIQNSFPAACGIVYCFSRSDCEKTTSALKAAGISAATYHAGLSPPQRESAQRLWLTNAIRVMVATIAFGMGIDKPDVRFVIHLTVPKSIEGYYQECGRAGRDGKNSTCILFYAFSDSVTLMSMVETKRAGPMDKFIMKDDVHTEERIDSVLSMVKFCEDRSTCRRLLLSNYFGANKNITCNGQWLCDNCETKVPHSSLDVTSFAQIIVESINQFPLGPKQVSVGLLVNILKGSKCKNVLQGGFDHNFIHGLLKSWKKNTVEKFIRKLILEKYISLKYIANSLGYKNAFIAKGVKANTVTDSEFSLSLFLPEESNLSTVDGDLSDGFEN